MEKNQAKSFVKEVLQHKFDQEKFELLVKNLLNDYEERDNNYSGNLIPEAFRDHIANYKRIGKYSDPDGIEMDILIVHTKTVSKLERTRTALRNFVVRHLKSFDKNYALVAFYSKEDHGEDWRLSFVKIDVEQFKDAKGKIKTKDDIVPAKRFSFLVGENEDAYTAQKQLLPILTNDVTNPLIEKEDDGDGSIEGAFSIEKVTDEFYEQYKELYLKLTENQALISALQREGMDIPRFVKKLLGQIVFLYFLQKKGWLGVPKDKKMGEGSKRFLQNQFDQYVTNDNYFKSFLRFLFYEALAREHNDHGIKYYFERLDCKIPFLNGGLFEAEYDWENSPISIPNELFRNEEKNKAGDKGTGILDVFDRYNFTIKEDEPLEKEVAVDPEMLGKVFENMLEITERKSKGAFYTPREVVHYMCQESLIHYLDNAINNYPKTYQPIDSDQLSMVGGSMNKKGTGKIEFEHGDIKVPKEDLEIFIRNGHLVLENEMVTQTKGKETKYYKFKLPESIRSHADDLDSKLTNIKICDPAIGSGAFPVGLLHEIVIARQVLNSFIQNEVHTPYYLKRHAIQESIYGVDIDASAIDIARLRLWLSMIVDEEDYENIDALPNLDYKIVYGNTLIGLPEQGTSRYPKLGDDLESLKQKFFSETDQVKKTKLREKIDQQISRVLEAAMDFEGYKIDFDFKLFFSEVWHEKGGFDIVIANPPYVDIKQLPKEFVKFLFDHFETTQNRINLYSIFLEKAWKMLNRNGGLIFINPNSILQNSSYKKIRSLLIKGVDKIIKLPDNVFKDATVETIIISASQQVYTNQINGAFYKNDESVHFDDLKFNAFDRVNWRNDLDIQFNIFINPALNRVLSKIEKKGKPLVIDYDCCLGITPYDKYKGHSEELIKSRGFHSTEKLSDEYVPLISGSNILRYIVNNLPIDEYLNYGDWLGAPRQKKFFTYPRVIVRQIISGKPGRIYAGFTSEELYHTQIGFSILNRNNSEGAVVFLAVVMSSDVVTAYHRYRFLDIEKKTFQKILIENCKKLPIPELDEDLIVQLKKLISYYKFLSKTSENVMDKYFDSILNGIVYELYLPEELKSARKQIIKNIGELHIIDANNSDEVNLAIIKSEFDRLYDPNHPVRNNLETLDSIEEIRIIKEALK
ncbi:MAG: N-6 DNA methylase [Bacteroidota bacterium]